MLTRILIQMGFVHKVIIFKHKTAFLLENQSERCRYRKFGSHERIWRLVS